MKLLIGGVERELKFGKVGFIRKLDEVYKAEYNGIKFGMGLNLAATYLKQNSIPALVEVITAAAEGKPKRSEVDEAIEKFAEDAFKENPETDAVEKLFDEVQEELGKHPLTKATMKKFNKVAKETEAKEATEKQE